MRKFIEISEEVLVRLVSGKCVEGRLRRDECTGKVMFVAYNRKPRHREKDKLVKKLPWGWVKESIGRIKVFSSFPKDLGTAQMMAALDHETKEAKNALIDRELIEFV